ncbi:MAG: hypothetical protein JSV88_24865 [Candidatus Aminicenantes bacterium]|nr:MAG: hypothetical protein JSV88_24865 [Candidatus Aminicenantes bacterium]
MKKILTFSLCGLACWVSFTINSQADSWELKGYTETSWPCVSNVVESFNKLDIQGDILGFHMNGAPDVTLTKHWQGIQRLQDNSGQPYLIISRSGEKESAFVVVKMGSKKNRGGKRLLSNRFLPSVINNTAPPSEDGIEKYVSLGSDYKHAGGIQLYSNILVVPLEEGSKSVVQFYNMENPLQPELLPPKVVRGDKSAGTASLTKLSNGSYLLAVGGDNAQPLDFYISNTKDLSDVSTQFSLIYSWTKDELFSAPGNDRNWGAYQNIQFVNQCDGRIHLVCTYNDSVISCVISYKDWADLYLLEKKGSNGLKLTKVAKKNCHCDTGRLRQCNFDASGGIYEDSTGSLILYSTEHDNDGPGGTVKFKEFSSEPCCCQNMSEAFVSLYEDRDFVDRMIRITSAMNISNFEDIDFGDKTSSAKWCIPVGHSVILYQHDTYRGRTLILPGTGKVEQIANFKDKGFNDETSSLKWQ